MGCINIKKHNRIVAMQTVNKDQVFTSTADVHQIYTFGRVLGIGSFGKVQLARMKNNTTKQVAIKIIDKRRVKGKESLLANEIYVLQRLDHPNIIKFYEVYQSELYFYICMDYCSGGELVERIAKQQQGLSEGQVQGILSKICSAVAYIHDQGIVHRDIKPENIMFSEKDITSEPKLIDFGLANKYDFSHIKRLKTFVGTPLYLPPEVIDGDYDERCDIWSLGVLLYSLLCGYPPFYGKNRNQLYDNIQKQQLVYDRKHWKNTSDEVKDLIRKMLLKNPKKRPSAKDCLTHPWFTLQFNTNKFSRRRNSQLSQMNLQQHSSRSVNLDDNRTIYEMLRNFRSGAKFKKEVMKVLVNQMNENELKSLKLIFQKIDVDNSGTITIDELRQALHEEGSFASNQEIEALINTIALEDNEGESNVGDQTPKPLVIKYSDFLAACIDERRVFTREKLWSLFKYFDTSNVNFITKEDIKEAFARLGKQQSDEKIDSMIYEIDPNHDNQISFEEFSQMMGVIGVEQTMDFRDEIKENTQEEDKE